jgi:hypothetical protein
MPVKDKIVNWFIQNLIIPKREVIDQPGFIISRYGGYNQDTYLRDLMLSEKLFEIIENNFIEQYGEEGKKVLYSSGKKFGYLYASLSNFSTKDSCSEKDFFNFSYNLVRYMEVTYANKAIHEIIYNENIFTITFKDYIVCRNNGFGLIMNEGGISGIWAYMNNDPYIEGVQIKCQGRKDDECYLICAPTDVLKKRRLDFFLETDLIDYKLDGSYLKLNKSRKTQYAKNSLKTLLDFNFINYEEGIFKYHTDRLFGCESHIIYILENELSKLENGKQLLFKSCYKYGSIIMNEHEGDDYKKFIMDFFPALGFGDIIVIEDEKITININFYPWSVFSNNSEYIICRGIMSGIVSSAKKKEIVFNEFFINIGDFLSLTISANQ